MPRWVKVLTAITVFVLLVFLILMVARGPGGHGPRRHMSLGGISVKHDAVPNHV